MTAPDSSVPAPSVGPTDKPTTGEALRRVVYYDPRTNDYALDKDPRCLWGWGGCGCRFGHACFRKLGHKGKCWDGGEHRPCDLPCESSQRPKNWDVTGRTEANT